MCLSGFQQICVSMWASFFNQTCIIGGVVGELDLGKLDSHPQRTHVKLRGISERTYYGLQTTAVKQRLLVSLVANLVLMSTRSITFFRNKCGRADDGRGPLVSAKPCERQLVTVLVYDGLPISAMFVFAPFAADGTN